MTWIGAPLGALLGLGLLLAGTNERLLDRANLSQDAGGLIKGIGVFLIVWSLAALILAVLAFRGSRGAAIALLVMAGIYLLLGLFSLASGDANGLLIPVYSMVAAVLIFTGVRKWTAGRT